MEFVILICVNIAMFAIFYLIISLKLERSASEFREKKLRKVMDDIIKEFNETSERNISILENKISVMKRLLDASGSIKSIDIRVSDDVSPDVSQAAGQDDTVSSSVFNNISGTTEFAQSQRRNISTAERIGDRFLFLGRRLFYTASRVGIIIREKLLGGMNYRNRNTGSTGNNSPVIMPSQSLVRPERESLFDYTVDEQVSSTPYDDFTIEKDYTDIKEHLLAADGTDEIDKMSERELTGLFTSSEDKYNLISDLFNEGYTIELLSKSSGIPVGEIRLVLNLNNS